MVAGEIEPRARDERGKAGGFFGKEDHHLRENLLAEFPGILQWTAEGWRDLQTNGFRETEYGRDAFEHLELKQSPLAAWARECLEHDRDAQVESRALYESFTAWSDDHDVLSMGQPQFGREFRQHCAPVGVKWKQHAYGSNNAVVDRIERGC